MRAAKLRLEQELAILEAKRQAELDDEEALLALILYMPTSNTSWLMTIYTQGDTKQVLDSLNGVGIPIFLLIK